MTDADKLKKKWREEDIELHKKVITSFLRLQNIRASTLKKFFILYDNYINWKNIEHYFHLSSKVFVVQLVTYTLKPPIKVKKSRKKCTSTKRKVL